MIGLACKYGRPMLLRVCLHCLVFRVAAFGTDLNDCASNRFLHDRVKAALEKMKESPCAELKKKFETARTGVPTPSNNFFNMSPIRDESKIQGFAESQKELLWFWTKLAILDPRNVSIMNTAWSEYEV